MNYQLCPGYIKNIYNEMGEVQKIMCLSMKYKHDACVKIFTGLYLMILSKMASKFLTYK